MKRAEDLNLDANQQSALKVLSDLLQTQFPIEEIVLFGSVARGDADEESDMDVLIVTKDPMDREQERDISKLVLRINLTYDANINTVVVDRHNWTSGPISVLPFHHNVVREGMKICPYPDGVKFTPVSDGQYRLGKDDGSRKLKNSTQIKTVATYWWEKADESLGAAERDLQADALTFAVNRLYYSLFYAVSAMLLSRGYDSFTKHTGVQSVFNRDFIRTGLVDQELGALYNQLFENRQKGDYEAFADFSNEEVVNWLEKCKIFLEKLRPLVKFPNLEGEE